MALPNLPQSRNEKYLAKIAGQEVELPNEPLSREEQYLDYIAKNGGGGGGYVLPTATELRLGGVKIGSGINVEEDGTISAKQDELTFDNVPTANSTNPVKSGGVYSADEAIRKWTTAEAKSVSGNPITLTDGSARNAEGLAVTCNPKQNLHGYDHPWAGGAGKNKLPMVLADIKSANTSGTWSGNAYTLNGVTFTVETDADSNVTGVKVDGTSSATTYFNLVDGVSVPVNNTYKFFGCDSFLNGVAAITYAFSGDSDVDVFKDAVTKTKSGTFTHAHIFLWGSKTFNNVMVYPMFMLASESDDSFEPYTNECPITGYTECVVDRDGRNLLDPDNLGHNTYNPATGQSGGTDPSFTSTTNMIAVEAGKTYCLSKDGTMASARKFYYSADGTYVSTVFSNTAFTIPSGVSYLNFHTGEYSGSLTGWQLEQSAAVTPYQPYAHDTATITFGQTVYGGSVNFKTGKVTVTHGIKDLGTLDYTAHTNISSFYAQLSDAVTGVTGVTMDGICSQYKAVPTRGSVSEMMGQGDNIFAMQNGSKLLFIKDTSKADLTAAQFADAMDGVQLCYELETPTTIQLTPAELELLKGYNYVTTNGTTIALAYLPNSLLAEAENYVDAKIPPALSSVTVTADGSKSVSQLLNDLFLLVDMTKITSGSKLIRATSTSTVAYHIVEYTASSLYYSYDIVTSEHWQILTFILKDDDSSYHQVYDNTRYDKSSDVPASGTTFAIYY